MTARRVLALAWRSLWLHRLRSLLTLLGIVIGVGSVVAMLAIGEGASAEAQARIARLGSRNLILASIKPPSSEEASEERQRVLEYGLLHADLRRIRETVPDVARVVEGREAPEPVRRGARKVNATVVGTTPDYADVALLRVAAGRYLSPVDDRGRLPVCVLGAETARRLFLSADPLERMVWAGEHPYRVVGVLETRGERAGGTGAEANLAVFIPLSTMQERYGDLITERTTGTFRAERVQLHRIVVESTTVGAVPRVAAALRAMLNRWHPQDDVRLTVPLELLREARETKRQYTILLGAIAAISLIVGGIGIMNIMLASVLERTREVGIRRALGARRRHIVVHFLAETVLLSGIGGLIGLLLGVGFPAVLSHFFDTRTLVAPYSLVLAFGISAVVGVVFGLYPAMRAADLDPVEALRHE